MKKTMIGFCAAILVLMLAGGVNASYIGTLKGNDKDKPKDIGKIVKFLEPDYGLGGQGLDFLYKIEVEDGLSSGGFSISSDGTSGTWTAPDATDVDFVTIKAGKEFSIFLADNFDWNTLNQKHDISHISFWSAPGYDAPPPGGSAAVPEPATIALLLGGLGVLGFNRFRKKRRVRD